MAQTAKYWSGSLAWWCQWTGVLRTQSLPRLVMWLLVVTVLVKPLCRSAPLVMLAVG